MIPDNVWSDARRAFLRLPGVIGVGWGDKIRSGKVVGHQSVIVFVDKKLPVDSLPADQVIPETFQGAPTDVRVPLLTPGSDPEAPPGADFCLTDHTWIDWGKVHRRHLASSGEG
jgi:hypothetical protein